jgi:ABC-type xylose transport system permease subunit
VSASALIFLASLALGVFPAFLVAILFGIVITAVQGALVGYIRANPLLVSIAALSLLIGGAALATGGQRIYPGGEGLQVFTVRLIQVHHNVCQLVRRLHTTSTTKLHPVDDETSFRGLFEARSTHRLSRESIGLHGYGA